MVEPKPIVPVEIVIQILQEYCDQHGCEVSALASDVLGEEKLIIISVRTNGEFAAELKAEITQRLKESIQPIRISIYFVDQTPYHPPPSAASL